ncbi:hypothetical protein PJI17_32060, partial [Mycobacterium kansasii]
EVYLYDELGRNVPKHKRKTFPNINETSAGTLGPNWDGPYIVSSTILPGTYRLENLSGQLLPHPWNAKHFKIYYP